MKIKILKLGWEFPPNSWGGLGTACHGLVKGLISHGVQVTLVLPYCQKNIIQNCKMICAKTENSDLSYLQNDGTHSAKKEIYNHLYANLFKKILRYAKSCESLAMQYDFDLIHAHDWMTFKAAIKIKNITGKQLIVHVHSTEFDRKERCIKPEIYSIEKKGMDAADKIITVSNFSKRQILKYYGVDSNKIKVVHNAISFNGNGAKNLNINCLKSLDHIVLKKLNKVFSNNKKSIILFLGRLTAQKGPEYFVSAAHKILQRKKDVEFVVAGDGDMKKKLFKQASKLGISQKMIFTGFLRGDAVDYMYSKADVYVMPSVSEPFGISPLESMKNGTPVVLSKNAGVCEVIENCLKVDFSDTHQIADQVINLLESKKNRQMLSVKGKEEIKKFSWNKVALKCLDIYKDLNV